MAESLALKAMRLLGRREYTRYELGKKLSPLADSPRDVQQLLGDFDAVKLVWAKKYSARPTTPMEWAKQARFLASRGFDSNVIRKVLTDPEFCVDTIDCYE